MIFSTLEIKIEQDNPVRFVDAFEEHFDLSQLGFVVSTLKTDGRPAFESKLFLRSICMDSLTESVVVVDWKKYAFVIALAPQYASTELSFYRRFSEGEPDGFKKCF